MPGAPDVPVIKACLPAEVRPAAGRASAARRRLSSSYRALTTNPQAEPAHPRDGAMLRGGGGAITAGYGEH